MPIIILLIIFCSSFAAIAVDEISIVGLFRDRAVVEIDGVQRVLVAGQPSPEGVLLISSTSREAVIEIDGVRGTYTLGTRISNEYTEPTGQKSVIIAPDTAGMYVVNGSINDFNVDFIVDTGASLISMNRHQARRIGLDYKMKGEQALSSTAAGMDKIYIVRLNKVTVGDIVLNNVDGAVHDGDFPRLILLGNSFLSRIDMKREGQLLKLEQQ